MDSPVQTSITLPDGGMRSIIIEPVLKKENDQELHSLAVYKLFTDVYHDELFLFTELRERAHLNEDLHDETNPDYLGKIMISRQGRQAYEGDKLSVAEVQQLCAFITNC